MLKQYTEKRTEEADGSEVLDRNHRDVSEHQLVPRIIKRNRQAILVDPYWFYLFQRRRTGRRCSCFQVSTSPDGLCQVCFGTGVVGGYLKYGTTDEWFDTTYPGIRTVNVRPNWDQATRPVMFSLVPDATTGFVEFDWDIRASTRRTDLFQVVTRNQRLATTRVDTTVNGESMTHAAVDRALCGHTAVIRATLSRASPADPSPVLSHIYVRYLLCDETRIRMDIPRRSESITLAEYGVFDSFTSLSGWITDEVRAVGTEDFFKMASDGTFWKTIESSPNTPLGQNTSTTVQLRLIQAYESYFKFPTG